MKPVIRYSPLGRTVLLAVLVTFVASACKEVRMPGVYRIDIQQGNVITQEQLAALESGMEKRKVRFILGTPLITDAFNQDRWDYYYSLEQNGEERVQRIISVYFKEERLTRVTGDVRAATGPIELPERVDKVVTVPDGYRDEGLFASITPDFLSDKPKRQKRADDQPTATDAQASTETTTAADAPAAEVTAAAATTITPTSSDEPAKPPPTLKPTDIKVDAQDSEYLRDLLGGLGREAPGSVSATRAETTAGVDSNAQTSEEKVEEEGLLSRWAKRLGWGDAKEAETPPPTPAAPGTPTQ